MDAIGYSNFRQKLKTYMRQVNEDSDTLVVTSKDPDENIVVMSKRDYDAMQETMRIMSNDYLMTKIRQGDQQIRKHQTHQHELLRDSNE